MTDLIILGNGMAGMTAALYAKRANLDFKIVSKDAYDFGQIGNAILVENYPCAASQSGFDLAMQLHNQLEENGVEVEEHEVKAITKNEDIFTITYMDDSTDEALSVIYALGASHRQLNCEIEKGIPIHYCALCDGALYKDKTVAVIGGGDVAFTQAEYLSKICKNVHIIMCDRNITAAPATFERVSKIKNIKITYDFIVNEIATNRYFITNNEKQHKIIIFRKAPNDGKARLLCISVDGIFVAIGMQPNTKILENSELKSALCEQGYIDADESCSTSCLGFFAAGDVRRKRVRQSITAAADGANAINSAIAYLGLIKAVRNFSEEKLKEN